MTEHNEQPTMDLLDQAVRALRDEAVPEGPPAQVVASTVEALQTTTASPEVVRLLQTRRLMIRIARYGSIATAAAVLLALGGVMLLHRNAALAFGEVVERVKEAKSVTFITKMPGILQGKKGIKQQKFYIQGDAYRMEIPSAQEGAQVPPDAPPVLLAIIADAKQKKALQLDFVRKTAQIMKGDEKGWQEMAKGLANPVEQLRLLKDEDAERIGEEVLNGRKTQVYRLKKTDIFMGVRVTEPEVAKVWVDPKTSLPVRFAVERPADGGKVETVIVFEQFTWNKDRDPNLFKVEVPKGFTLKDK
jgi:hypothetical protein